MIAARCLRDHKHSHLIQTQWIKDPPTQPTYPGLAPNPNEDADTDDQMNDPPGEDDDADLPALEPIQPTPPTGPQTFDISATGIRPGHGVT